MADAHAPSHPYHLVKPSPWPLVGAISAFATALAAIAFMHGELLWWVLPGFLGILYTMLVWWRDVIHEGQEGDHTPIVQLGLRYGMILFIASEVMFFVAWFWAFFSSALNLDAGVEIVKDAFTGGVWPPKGIEVFDPWHLPLLNTLILLTSGTTVTWAHHALLHNDRKGLIWGLVCTIVLGMIFTSVQAYEYAHAAFSFGGNIYGSTFFMATGFHGFHVIVGTIFLIVCLIRAVKGHFTPEAHFGFEAAAWYWHFVDVVWIFLFFCIYVWGGWGRTDRWSLSMTGSADKALYPDLPPSQTGMRGRCPRCGEGRLFKGFLGLQDRCQACGLDYNFSDSGDGPAVFIIMIVGFIVVGLALFVEFSFGPPFWVHILLWVPLVLILAIGLLRPLKGLMIAQQYKHRAQEGRIEGT